MIIAADIGNTNIKFGVFDGSADNMLYGFTVSASSVRSSDEYRLLINYFLKEKFTEVTFDGSVISSVVPALNVPVAEALTVICGRKPFFVGSGTKTGFPIKIDVVSEIGSDIVSNVARAHGLLSPPFAVVDMGTAITLLQLTVTVPCAARLLLPDAEYHCLRFLTARHFLTMWRHSVPTVS